MKGDCSTVLLFLKKKDPRIWWNLYRDKKKFWAGVSRYPFPGRNEAVEEVEVEVEQFEPFIRGKIRSVCLT